MGAPPRADEALARRLETVGDRFMLEWLAGTGAELRSFGAATAAVDPSRPELDFVNRVYGLWPEDAEHVGEIAAFYRDRGVRGWLELAPAARFEALAASLALAGGAQIGFHAVLSGPAISGERGDIQVERASNPELFADVLLRGHGVPEGARVRDRSSVGRWSEIEGWRLYLALVDGSPAGAAMLTLDDDVGYLANASTLPAFRRRGVQGALIAARIADARAAGCEAVCSQAEFGSASQRNLERAGLSVAYTKAVWRLNELPSE
jgi:ribosomal protein S18 acetylase RimI-like enzyme